MRVFVFLFCFKLLPRFVLSFVRLTACVLGCLFARFVGVRVGVVVVVVVVRSS